MNQPSFKISNLKFGYRSKQQLLIDIANLSLNQTEHLFIEGPSGSGKTTLLNLFAGVQQFTMGQIELLGTDLLKLSQTQLDKFRADHLGIIFQLFNLIPYLSVIENVLLPCQFSKIKKEKVLKSGVTLKDEALRLIKSLGLTDVDIYGMRTVDLSVGQQQRVAAARALMGSPEIIFADEPTSALDQKNTDQFMQLLLKECEKHKSSLVFVSHDQTLKKYFKNVFSMKPNNAT